MGLADGEHPVIVRDSPYGVPIAYGSWAHWRVARRHPERVWLDAPGRPCPLCWGQRKIWDPGPLGLLPVICEACAGTGRVVD
jgi:hypothetical protein